MIQTNTKLLMLSHSRVRAPLAALFRGSHSLSDLLLTTTKIYPKDPTSPPAHPSLPIVDECPQDNIPRASGSQVSHLWRQGGSYHLPTCCPPIYSIGASSCVYQRCPQASTPPPLPSSSSVVRASSPSSSSWHPVIQRCSDIPVSLSPTSTTSSCHRQCPCVLVVVVVVALWHAATLILPSSSCSIVISPSTSPV